VQIGFHIAEEQPTMTNNPPSLAAAIASAYQQGHQRILSLAERMTDEQLHWQPTPHSLPIAFHLWHVARWADFTGAAIPGMTPELSRLLPPTPQIWEADQLGQRWGFDAALGYKGTGMEMDEEAAARLLYPSKEALLDYARRAFAAVEQMVAAIPQEQMSAPEQVQPMTADIWGEDTVGGAVLSHVAHDNRHLGAMECLLGQQTGGGTASI
jgi:hypothetical protein